MLALGARSTPLLRIALGAVALGALLLAATSHPERFGVPHRWSEAPSAAGIAGSFVLAFGWMAILLLALTRNLPRPYARALAIGAVLFALGMLLTQWNAYARIDRHHIASSALTGAAFAALLWPSPWGRRVAILAAIAAVATSIAFTLGPSSVSADGMMMTAPGVYEPIAGIPAAAREAARWLAPTAAALVALAFGVAAMKPATRST